MTAASPTIAQATPLRQDAAVIGLVGLAHASSHFSHLLLPLMWEPSLSKRKKTNLTLTNYAR